MGFGDLRRILNDRTRRIEETGLNPVQYQETIYARSLLEQLRTNYIIAYKQRKDKWFRQHSDQQFFSPSLEETRRDTELQEWLWYFISRISERTPEQRYQDEKRRIHGWNHKSNSHGIDEPCVEGCRFWPDEGRIEDVEVLKDYEEYDRYEEVLEIWTGVKKE
ncbi:MAG TPA: hypothetical protein VE130_10520 [Nitrososphaeraceae archaeon]|jgi:hypothetical protein|nr:hypothetical protein [Nitrososphaeraceae archaeon]